MYAVSEAPEIIVFGRFRLFPRRRELLADGVPVKLGGRAFDILTNGADRGARRRRVEGRADGDRVAGPGRRREQSPRRCAPPWGRIAT